MPEAAFQADTIAAYADAGRALSEWMTGQGVDGDFTACDTAMLNRFFVDYLASHGQGGTNTRQRNLRHLFTWLDQSAVVPLRRGPVRSWPLLVLAAPAAVAVCMGSALAHMLRSNASATAGATVQVPAALISVKDSNGRYPADQSLLGRPVPADVASVPLGPGFSALRDQPGDGGGTGRLGSYPGDGVRARPPARTRLPDAYSAAGRVRARALAEQQILNPQAPHRKRAHGRPGIRQTSRPEQMRPRYRNNGSYQQSTRFHTPLFRPGRCPS